VSFLLRYGRVLAIAALVAGLLALYSCQIDKAEQRGYDRARAEMAGQVQLANAAAAAAEQSTRNRVREVDNAHQKALADLDARYAASRLPTVRLCKPTQAGSRSELPKTARPAGRDTGAASGDGLSGRDIGPDLERIARAADEQTQRLIACQAYVNSAVALE